MGEIEFDAAVNGEYIPIPAAEDANKPYAPAYLANTKDLVFNRDEDYER